MYRWIAGLMLLPVMFAIGVGATQVTRQTTQVSAISKPTTTADALPLIAQGKLLLQEHNLLGARDQFALAVAADPANEEANLLYGVTRFFAIVDEGQSLNTSGLDSVREIFEQAGFLVSSFGVYSSDIDSSAVDSAENLASTTPTTGAVLDFLKTKALPELDAALANLEKVTSPSFSSDITAAAIGSSGTNLNVDYADALVIKALLNAVKCNLNLLMVYDLNVKVPDIIANPDQLTTYKNLFSVNGTNTTFLTVKDASRLTTARDALLGFIDTYNAAAPLLINRAVKAGHLFVVDAPVTTNEPVETDGLTITDTQDILNEIKEAVLSQHNFADPADPAESDKTVALSRFFNADAPIDLRSKLTDCTSGTVIPDRYFDGLFPNGFKQEEIDKLRSDAGIDLLGVACVGRETPLMQFDPDHLYMDGFTGPNEIALSNFGTATLTVTSLALGGTNPFDFTLTPGTCTSLTPILAPGASCTIIADVSRPVTANGYSSAQILVSSNDAHTSEPPVIEANFTPTTGGTITGFVRDSVSPEGIGIWVTLYDSNNAYVAGTNSNDTGGYAFSNLAAGTYKLFYQSNEHASQWFNNKNSFNTADAVVISGTIPVKLADVYMVPTGGIMGWVTNGSGMGLSNVMVQAFDSRNIAVTTVTTGMDGSYFVPGLPSGAYRILFDGTATGYVRQFYGGGVDIAAAGTVQVSAPDHAEVDASLAAGGSIAGWVANDGENPLANLLVRVYDENDNFLSQTQTDTYGNYVAKGLPTGKHKVRFEGYTRGYVNQYYGSTLYASRAVPVAVTAPDQTGGINGYLRPGGSISGKVTKPDGITGVGGVNVEVYDTSSGWISATTTRNDGTYTAVGVPAGNFKIAYFHISQSGPAYAAQWYGGQGNFTAASVVAVTTSRSGINATLGSGKNIYFNGDRRNFGDTPVNATTRYRTITVRNLGTAPLATGQITKSGVNAAEFSFANDRCSNSTMAAGGSCTFQVYFTPASTGDKTVDLAIPSDDPDTPLLGITVKGTGFSTPGSISVTPSSVAFGNVTVGSASPATMFTIRNDGPESITVTDGYMTGAEDEFDNVDTGSGNCPELPHVFTSGESCMVGFTFNPTTAGVKAATIVIESNASNLPTATITLTGTGLLQNHALTTNIVGSGTINNLSAPPPFTCGLASCTDSFPAGTTFTLRATPAAGELFVGWSGACEGTGDCVIAALSGNTSVTATFGLDPVVQITGRSSYFNTLQTAFNAVDGNGLEIRAMTRVFTENLLFDQPYTILLTGGLATMADLSPSGETAIKGSLTIRNGGMTIERVIIF